MYNPKAILNINAKLSKPTLLLSLIVMGVTFMGFKIGALLGVYLTLFGLLTGLNARYLTKFREYTIIVLISLLVLIASYFQGNIIAITIIIGIAALASGVLDYWAVGIGHIMPVAVAVVGMVPHGQSSLLLFILTLAGCVLGSVLVYLFKIYQNR